MIVSWTIFLGRIPGKGLLSRNSWNSKLYFIYLALVQHPHLLMLTTFNAMCAQIAFQFMLRGEVLKLYRDMLRCLRQIPSESDRKDMCQWVREDFKANKDVSDEVLCYIQLILGSWSN